MLISDNPEVDIPNFEINRESRQKYIINLMGNKQQLQLMR